MTTTLALDRAAGSRMHMLDWLEGGLFIPDLNSMLRPTNFFVPESGHRMPAGWHETTEAKLGKECESLIDDGLNIKLLNWWLVNVTGANVPNWDLACEALCRGNRRAIVLAEAKAYVREFTNGAGAFGSANAENREQITKAIAEARDALSKEAPEVKISADKWYQFSNRVAFAWKLASEGLPTVLMYLGFTGDAGISKDFLRNEDHWREVVTSNTNGIFPSSLWEREINCGPAPLWILLRSKPCIRQSLSSTA